MKKFYLSVLLCLLFGNTKGQSFHPDFHDGLISFKIWVDSTALPLYPYEGTYPVMDSLINKYGVRLISKSFPFTENSHLAKCYTTEFDSIGLIDSFISDMSKYGFIEFASKTPIKRPLSAPNDNKYNLQWALSRIVADSVWALPAGTGKEIVLAVIDDAVRLNHEEFENILNECPLSHLRSSHL